MTDLTTLLARVEALRANMTPGPWKVYRTTDGSRILGIGDAEAGGVTDPRFGMWRDGEEKEANAAAIALLPEVLDALVEVVRERDNWRNDFRALEKAIVGETGLSAMTVALQAKLFRPRAEAAEAKLAAAEATIASLRAVTVQEAAKVLLDAVDTEADIQDAVADAMSAGSALCTIAVHSVSTSQSWDMGLVAFLRALATPKED